MRKIHWACLCLCVVAFHPKNAPAQTPWPDFQATLQPDDSTSEAKAVLPPDIKISAAAPGMPSARAKFLGEWEGWMCRNAASDVKAAFESIEGDDVSLVYAVASTRGNLKPSSQPVKAKFVGNEVQGQLTSGAQIIYRLRQDGNLDVMWRSARGPNWCSGVLMPITSASVVPVRKNLCGANVPFRLAGVDPREGIYLGSFHSITYGGEVCAGFGVERINGDGTASLIYFYGKNPEWHMNSPGWIHYLASVSGNTVTVANPKIVLNLKGAQADGYFRDEATAGSFNKQ